MKFSASDTQTIILNKIEGRVLNTRSFQYVGLRFLPNSGKKKRAVILKVFILSLAPVWHEESIAVRRRSRRRHNERQWNVGLCRNYSFTFCWPASRYIHWRKHQLDAQFIYSIVRQTPLHVSAVSTAHHQEIHRMDKTIGTYCYF